MPDLSIHLQDSTAGEVDGVMQAVARASSVAGITRMDAAVAYASAAGVDMLERQLAHNPGWQTWQKRFLISIDFGTTEAAAFQRLSTLPNSEVRIPRGLEVLRRSNLVPRVPFHSKMWMFYRDSGAGPLGLVIGSGNLTRSGMATGGEIAASLTLAGHPREEWPTGSRQISEWFDATWASADPADDVLPTYTNLVRRLGRPNIPAEDLSEESRSFPGKPAPSAPANFADQLVTADALFVRIDRASRNRGQDRPGNQIDLPLGTSRFFHLPPRQNVGVVGTVALRVASFPASLCNIRVGSNSMDKVNLPVPESVGIDTYDDTYLIFTRTNERYDDAPLFELNITDAYGLFRTRASVSSSLMLQMSGGRRYGLLFT